MRKMIILCTSAIMLMGCGALSGVSTTPQTTSTATQQVVNLAQTAQNSTSNSAAVNAGRTAGTSILGLYNQCKADGKYDYKNFNNISNTILLLANCADLPNNVKDKAYMKEFGQGMMLSAVGLITEENVEAVTGNLVNIAGQYADKAAEATSSVADKLTTAAQTASAISSMLMLFQQQ